MRTPSRRPATWRREHRGDGGSGGSIQKYSGQTDDSIVKAQGLLLTFTNIRNAAGKNNDIFTQATKITADMAQKFGGDASDSAVRLGKALNDPIKGISALSKIGVSFTAAQKKQIKTMQDAGNIAGAQKVILAELNKEVGGSAEAYGKTLPGQIDRAKRAFEDVTQALVTKMLPALTSGVEHLMAFGGWVQKNQAWLKPLVAVLGTAAATFFVVTKAIAAMNIVLALMGSATTIVLGPIGLVIIGVAALAAGLIYAYKHSETFRRIVDGAFKAIGKAASFMWNGVIKPVFQLWLNMWFTIVGALVNGAASAFGWVPGLGPKLKSAAAKFNEFRDSVNASLDGISPIKNIAINFTSLQKNNATAFADPETRHIRGYVAPKGANQVVRQGDVYLDSKKVGEALAKHVSRLRPT